MTVLGVVAALFVGVAGAEQRAAKLAQVTNCGHERCSWRATVLADGTLFYENFAAPARGGKRALKTQEFEDFRRSLERERPWEITGSIGDIPIHGPTREVRLFRPEGFFRLMATPKGFPSLYSTDTSQLARALRFCQAAYTLLADPSLPDCVDERP